MEEHIFIIFTRHESVCSTVIKEYLKLKQIKRVVLLSSVNDYLKAILLFGGNLLLQTYTLI